MISCSRSAQGGSGASGFRVTAPSTGVSCCSLRPSHSSRLRSPAGSTRATMWPHRTVRSSAARRSTAESLVRGDDDSSRSCRKLAFAAIARRRSSFEERS